MTDHDDTTQLPLGHQDAGGLPDARDLHERDAGNANRKPVRVDENDDYAQDDVPLSAAVDPDDEAVSLEPDHAERVSLDDIDDTEETLGRDRPSRIFGAGAGGSTADDAAGKVFGCLPEFVDRYLLVMYRRAVSGNDTTWCAEWWRHPEAIVRLDALWRSWESQRLDPATGISVWMRDHCDFHMRVLLSADGPLKGCKPDAHSVRALQPLPSAQMPAEMLQRLQHAGPRDFGGSAR